MSTRIALVGHVDHGKSTLIGRILSDTAQAREERQEKVMSFCQSRGKKFEYAFLIDALEEEQSQGITIDTTEVNWIYQNRDFVFIDTPGHREFLKKMVGGASSVDAAILIVDAVEGPKDSFQRQLMILELLGVKQLIVTVNKMDMVSWNENIWTKLEKDIRSQINQSFLSVSILPIAAWHGANLVSRSVEMPWYLGPTLSEVLMATHSLCANEKGPTRFYIQDVYQLDEKQVYVGRLESGTLCVGDDLQFLPGHSRGRVKTIEAYEENRLDARSGDAVGFTLEEALPLVRGTLAYAENDPPKSLMKITADIFWLDSVPLQVGDRLNIRSGPQSSFATISRIDREIDGDTFSERKAVQSLGLFGRVQFNFETPWNFDFFEQCEPTGRFVTAREGKVLGGGRWVQNRPAFFERSDAAVMGQSRVEQHKGRVLWFTGLSGSGKTTIAKALEKRLLQCGVRSIVLDGDRIREGLCRDLGFSLEDRSENLRRVAEVARLMAEVGLVVISAFISPLADQRRVAKDIIGDDLYSEIFIDCPLEICESRDPKGLYAKARNGQLEEFTGISSVFEKPGCPDVKLSTNHSTIETAVDELLLHVFDRVGIKQILSKRGNL
ncbi:MAG: adenylyl-sulfate kinase [Bdellovibrionales bacterium]|nr:adenylyl-sulfate kinase [Bdellovibrionales bacterium]